MPPYRNGFKRRRYSPYGARKVRVLVPSNQTYIGAGRTFTRQGNAAAIIATTPALKGYARSQGRYYGRFSGGNNPEMKFFDTQHDWDTDTTGEVPATGQLNLIPQGINESERIGRKITIKRIDTRLLIQAKATATFVGSIVRICLVQDQQCNGAAATYSGVNGVLDTDIVTAFRNLENTNRFKILKDWYFAHEPHAGAPGANNLWQRTLRFGTSCNIPIEWDSSATTGVIGTIRSNNLFFICRSSKDDDGLQVLGTTRIRYTDA